MGYRWLGGGLVVGPCRAAASFAPVPDADAWPALLAEVLSLIRERLVDHGDTVEVSSILNELMERRGYDRYTADGRELGSRGDEYALDAGEVAYLTSTALQILSGSAEIIDLGGSGPHYPIRRLLTWMGHEELGRHDFRMPQRIAATPVRVAIGAVPETGQLRWPEVEALIRQSVVALRHDLAVLALVGARIAVEEAVRAALSDLGVAEEDQPWRPWQREDLLFDVHLASSQGFTPLDRTATRTAVSGIRSAGNDAAHTGTAPDAHLNEVLVFQAPRAVASLSAAVDGVLA